LKFPAWVDINLDALIDNITAVRSLVGEDTKVCLVVKADAYGHGSVEVSRAALDAGVHMLGVATLHEGIELRRAGITAPMIVLSPSLQSEMEELVTHGLRPSVSSLTFARALSRMSLKLSRTTPFHVEVDTGMGRTGLDYDAAYDTLKEMAALPGLRMEGVFTHFPDADSADGSFARSQVHDFQSLLAQLEQDGISFDLVHAANSAGIVNIPESRLNMVRPGLLAYGLRPPGGSGYPEIDVRPVMSFKSCVVQLRNVRRGRFISYSRTYCSGRDSVIAVVPVGYGHGYSWTLSNAGEMLVCGTRAPIVGRVTMDLTMLDVTDVPGVKEGAEVVLFGRQGGATITVEEVAAKAGTLSYEILCSIGKRVVRSFIRHNKRSKVITLVGERKEEDTAEGGMDCQPAIRYISGPAIHDERG